MMDQTCNFVTFIFSVAVSSNTGEGLAITEMIVPSVKKLNSTVILQCNYDLDGDTLYSVKWYKGSHGK